VLSLRLSAVLSPRLSLCPPTFFKQQELYLEVDIAAKQKESEYGGSRKKNSVSVYKEEYGQPGKRYNPD